MTNVSHYLKQNTKFYGTQVGYYNFYYPDKLKSNFSNIKKGIITITTWICPSGLQPFYFKDDENKVIYWCDKECVEVENV